MASNVEHGIKAVVHTVEKDSITASAREAALQTAQEQVVDRVLNDITTSHLPSQLASSSSNPNQGLHGIGQEFMAGPSNLWEEDIAPADD